PFVEEVADAEIERSEDLQQRVEADFVLSLFHPGEIGLVDADPIGELHLRQLALAAELPDLPADELDLRGFCHLRIWCAFYAIPTRNCRVQSTDTARL